MKIFSFNDFSIYYNFIIMHIAACNNISVSGDGDRVVSSDNRTPSGYRNISILDREMCALLYIAFNMQTAICNFNNGFFSDIARDHHRALMYKSVSCRNVIHRMGFCCFFLCAIGWREHG